MQRQHYQDKLGGDWVNFTHEEVADAGAALKLSPESRITPRMVYVAISDMEAMGDIIQAQGINIDTLKVQQSTESSLRKCAPYDPSWLLVKFKEGRVFLFQDDAYIVDRVSDYDRGEIIMTSLEGDTPKRARFSFSTVFARLERDPREDSLMDIKSYLMSQGRREMVEDIDAKVRGNNAQSTQASSSMSM